MKVNNGTKKANELKWDFRHHYYKGDTLYEVYESPSSAKVSSYRAIEEQCRALKGEHLHITGASCHTYSCMYAFKNEDGNWVLRKETHANTYDLEISEEEYNELVVR